MRRARVAVMAFTLLGPIVPAAAIPLVAHAATCGAQPGGPYPNDPSYASAETAAGQAAGNTWDGEDWYLYDCIPQTAHAASDPQGASGMSVAALWNRNPNPQRGAGVLVAYTEGGVNWRIAQSCELKDRAWLNTAELPYPEDVSGLTKPQLAAAGQTFTNSNPYDLNDDGVVNVEDYLNDPRVAEGDKGQPKSPAGGPFLHHVCFSAGTSNSAGYAPTDITPEDLIVAFGHCQIQSGAIVGSFPCDTAKHYDNDHDGYANDINGWNFNRDDNDPQTEQSVYAHFDGESSTLAGEGNNGFRGEGVCPECRYIPIKAGDEAIDRPDRIAEAIVFAANVGVNVMDVSDASLGLNQNVQDAINYAYRKGMVIVWASNDFESADHTDGMYYANVWPGNSITGDHSTRGGATCPPAQNSSTVFCPWVESDNTFLSRSSLTSYGPHSLFSVPNTDGSTSTGTPTNAGVAALVVAEGKAAASRGEITSPLSANEVRQVVRASALTIAAPCPPVEPCFTGPSGATFNIMYGYGRPDVLTAASLIDANHIPPSANIDSPSWYQAVDPIRQSTLPVTVDVSAVRASGGSYTWQLQYGFGPQPLDNAWTTFATGTGASPKTVSGAINLSNPTIQAYANAAHSIDPTGRASIEQYDLTVRVQVFANGDKNDGWATGEDRRAIHLRHDPSVRNGAPLAIGSSGDASPTLADIEGRGQLDTILPTSDGSVHVLRPNGSEAPGFPVHTNPAPGMNPASATNYLSDPTWGGSVVPRPRDPIFSSAAVGDLTHTGALDIVVSTASGFTYAWDGTGKLVPGFPVLNGTPADFSMSVPPPNTPYSFQPENYAAASPVLAHLLVKGDAAAGVAPTNELDIIQAAGDNQLHAWRPNGTPVPGWPVNVDVPLSSSVPGASQRTHDSKTVTTPAVIDINGDGTPDVVLGLDDTFLASGPSSAPITAYLLAFDGRGKHAAKGGLLPGYPAQIPGLIQGYGVAQDFVTQGVESPAVFNDPANGPQAVVNANLFLPVRVNLRNGQVSSAFQPTTISPAPTSSSCPTPNTVPPTNPGQCTLVQFTTSSSLGKINSSQATPLMFQMGSAAVDVAAGITQTEGIGIRVDNGVGGWDPTSGTFLAQYSHYIQGLAFFAAPAIADVTGDGTPDIIVSADSGALMSFDGNTGQAATGFPKWTGGWSTFTPAVGDLAGNGHTDVVVATREGYLYSFKTSGNGCAGNSEAWHWHQNDWNDGRYGADTRPPSAITDLSVSRHGSNDAITFTATGNNWKCGTAARYQLFTSSGPITQGNVAHATAIAVTKRPDAAGTVETITIPASSDHGFLAIRAVDAAGNIGPIGLVSSSGAAAPALSAAAAAPASETLVGLLALLGIVAAPRRLRRIRARRAS